MLKIGEDKSISVTRGDSVVFGVSQKSKDGTLRVFNVGDIVRFSVVKKKDYSSVVLQKDFAVEESCEVVDVVLTSQETRIGDTINKAVEYWYEVEVNPGTSDTIIGHDVNGAKQFWLYPEAEAVEQPELKPEDIPVVDEKFDLTSKRPIANEVVAKAVLLLEEESDNLSQKVNEMEERIGVLTSKVKNLSTLKEGSTTGDAELIGIREGWDGTVYESAGEAVREQVKQAMGTAEKNAQDISTLQEHLGEFSNALKGSASGAIVSIDDISPIEHTMDVRVSCKNLLKTTNYSKGSLGADGTIQHSTGTFCITSDFISLPTGKYIISYVKGAEGIEGAHLRNVAFYNKNKEFLRLIWTSRNNNYEFTINEGESFIKIDAERSGVDGALGGASNPIINHDTFYTDYKFQLEAGTTVTEYTPYVEFSDVTLHKYGKNLLNNDTSLLQEHTFVYTTGVDTTNWGYKIPLPEGKYTLSLVVNSDAATSIYFDVNKDGVNITKQCSTNKYGSPAQYLITSADANYTPIKLDLKGTGNILYIYNAVDNTTFEKSQQKFDTVSLQLEVGDTATAYEPYIETIEYPVNADGTVDGVTPIYPTTTLFTDASGATVHCEYNRDINKLPAASGGVPAELTAKVNKNTTDILTHGVLIDENTKSIADIQGYLGYDDKDILGLEVDFERKTFTRLAGAKGLNAGEDFNQFSIYRDRVRCNVADNGTITSLYGEGDDEWKAICDAEALFEDFYGDQSQGVCNFPTSDEDVTYIPHVSYQGANIKITVTNKTADGVVTEFNSSLGVPGQTETFGEFLASDGKTVTLTGFPNGTWDGEGTATSYNGEFVLYVNPHTSDILDIKIELKTNESAFVDDGTNGRVMVYQPAFYYRVVPIKLEKQEDGLGYHIRKANYYISATPRPGFKLHPAFYDRNNKPLRYILYSAYEATHSENMSGLSSVAGGLPLNNLYRSQAESSATEIGYGWHIETIQAVSANQLLMMIEYGHPNIQSVFAEGPTSIPSGNFILTGSTSGLGNASGSAQSSTDDSGNTYSENGSVSISYRGMENPWGNVGRHIGGLYAENFIDNMSKCKIFIYPKDEEYIEGNFGNFCGFTIEQGFGSSFGYGSEEYDWLLIPSEGNGDSIATIGDSVRFDFDTEQLTATSPVIGGWCTSGDSAGLFSFDFLEMSNFTTACRLMYLPLNIDDFSNII